MVKFGWDKLKRFLAQANSWTGQQTFSNIAVTGGTISGVTFAENFTSATDPLANAAVSTTIVNTYNGTVVTLTAAGNTQTLQSPTTAATIRKFMVINNDTSNNNLSVVANSVTFVLTPGEGQCFLWDGSAWGPTDLGITSIPVPVTQGGTGASTLTNHGVLLGSGTDPITALGAMTNGQLVIGSTGNDPVVASITDGEGIDTTGGAGTLTIACEDASTTNKGVVELATVAETVAGTSTTLTPTCDGVAAAVAVLAREPDQGVAMTYAASGSSGITVADNDDIDYGTGNFFGVIPVLLADYTPAAEVVLEQKTDGTNGREFTLQTNGKLRVTINTTDYDSTVATGCTDNTKHVFGYSVTRETAAAAGSIIFVVDGVQLGDAVAITAGAPTTINNAVSQYVLGTSATRTAGTVNGYISGNRALTAAEHLALYRNGIAEADKWGSQDNLITSAENQSFGGETIGNWVVLTTGNGTCVYNAGPSAEKCALVTVGATAGTYTAGRLPTTSMATLQPYKKYRIKASVYLPSGHAFTSVTCGPRDLDVPAYATQNAVLTTVDVWQTIWAETTLSSDLTGSIAIAGNSTKTGDYFYFDDVSVVEIGATLCLLPENAQPSPGQWIDASTNLLHAMQPATGSSLTRPKDTFTVKWTNTWAGTHEAQYIGGVDQAVLPPNCYVQSIIGVITGSTIEDIIIGDGSDTDHWVAITTGLAAGTVNFTVANAISDGTNYKLVVDPDANFTGSIVWTIKGIVL